MRWVSTRVLPDPAPATTSSGPSVQSTASRCFGLRVSSDGATAISRRSFRLGHGPPRECRAALGGGGRAAASERAAQTIRTVTLRLAPAALSGVGGASTRNTYLPVTRGSSVAL